MRKVDNGEKRKEKKTNKREKNLVFSGHYVIASSLTPERRPLERCTLVPIQKELQERFNEVLVLQFCWCMDLIAATRAEGGLVIHISRNDKNSAEPKYSVNICYATPSLSSVCKVSNT